MSEQPEQPHPTPPEAPDVPRRVNLSGSQRAAAVLLLILPVLAALGVFGESFSTADASSAEMRLSAEYPSRLRFRLDSRLVVTIENTGQQTLRAPTVHFERDYIDRFVGISFMPSPTKITSDAYLVTLGDLAPGNTQVVTVQLQGSQYGHHQGRIWVSVDGQAAAELAVSSIVFP